MEQGFVASEIPFTPRAKRVLEMAVHEGQDLGVNFVGTEHVLISYSCMNLMVLQCAL